MGRQGFSRRALLSMSKVVEKEREGFFEKGNFSTIRTLNTNGSSVFNINNYSGQPLKKGDHVYVIGANMSSYPYEEACYCIENDKAFINVCNRGANDNDEDLMKLGDDLDPWEVKQISQEEMFFATVQISSSFDGSNDYYYAKTYTPSDNNIQWIYRPTLITTKKDDALYRIFDGSNLPWRLIYPDYYRTRKNKYADEEVPPRVVMALLQKLPNPTLPSGRYLATVASDTTIDSSKNINIVIENGSKTYEEKAISPLSSVGDKFREGQKVLVQPIDNMNSLFVIINAEC